MGERIGKRVAAVFAGIVLSAGLASAGEWKDDLERICDKTNDSESMSKEQLQALVKEADELLKRMEQINDPAKKVLQPKLQKCRNFFAYMIDLKDAGKGGVAR